MPADVPAWVQRLIGHQDVWHSTRDGTAIRVAEGGAYTLVSVHIQDAVHLDARRFQERTVEAYQSIARHLDGAAAPCPVRLWNYIPQILAPLGDLPHRYMVFNAGRHEAYARWRRPSPGWNGHLPTATGVGHGGDGLIVHCLAAMEPGQSVENPRQTPAFRYSSRYGPLPPAFSRATRLESTPNGRPWLLVGGTASVRGEDCVHLDDVPRQFDETLANLRSLVRVGSRVPAENAAVSLRVYHVGRARDFVTAAVAGRFGDVEAEFVETDLCRPELLLEVEGVFEYGPPRSSDGRRTIRAAAAVEPT